MRREWEALGYELRVHDSGAVSVVNAEAAEWNQTGWWHFRTVAAALAWLDQRARENGTSAS